MFRHLGTHSDEMLLALVLWLCSLPLVGLLVIPFFGLPMAGVVALGLLIVALAICWGVCTWTIFKR
jgi:hypothetical protein